MTSIPLKGKIFTIIIIAQIVNKAVYDYVLVGGGGGCKLAFIC